MLLGSSHTPSPAVSYYFHFNMYNFLFLNLFTAFVILRYGTEFSVLQFCICNHFVFNLIHHFVFYNLILRDHPFHIVSLHIFLLLFLLISTKQMRNYNVNVKKREKNRRGERAFSNVEYVLSLLQLRALFAHCQHILLLFQKQFLVP